MSIVQPLVSAATPTATITAVIKDNVFNSPFAMNVVQIGQFYLSTELFRLMHNYLGERLPNVLAFMLRTRTKTLLVPSTDSTYTWVTMWMVNQSTWKNHDVFEVTEDAPAKHGKGKLNLLSFRPGDGFELPDDKASNTQAYFNPATGVNYNFTFENCRVTIVREGDRDMTRSSSGRSVYRIAISPADAEVMQRFVKAARKEYQKQKDDNVEIYIAGKMHNYWNFLLFAHPRNLDTIHLAAGIKEKIVGMVDNFLNKKSDYQSLQISHHLGFCLYGPPGTGKTTLIRAIAYHFNLKIHVLNLCQHDLNDSRLHTLMASTKEGGIILIEDIDKQLDNPSSQITAAGLLQALEGSANAAAQIVFVTANSLKPLEPYKDTVFRHGRIDNKIELGYADKGMAKSLFCKFFSTCSREKVDKIEALSDQFSGALLENTWSMAHLEGYLLQHDENIHNAVSEFAEWQDKQRKDSEILDWGGDDATTSH